MYSKSRCIIIKTIDFKDADKLVTLFSERQGKVRAIAKGIKKPNSSLRACVQPFGHSFFSFSRSRGLGLITQGKLLDFYGFIRDDISLSLNTIYLMELLDKSLMENAPLARLYQITVNVLETLNNPELPYNPLLLRYYEMSLLKELGYMPLLDQCVSCNKSNVNLNFLSISEGGTVCDVCAKQTRNNVTISGESLAILRLLAHSNVTILARVKISERSLRQIELVLEKYLEYYLEQRLNVKDTIKTLKCRLSVTN
ncbi:MAG TPA: DNA repair protein RecO [Syntrophomonadaceae bacterium]|nr:DNA repair protein RecO [Syntrophomonadaceae bacterium]